MRLMRLKGIVSAIFIALISSTLFIFPTSANAVPNGPLSCGGAGTFTVSNNVVTSSSSDCSGAVTIPSGITGIGSGAFWTRGLMTSVSLPNTVTYIDNSAFRQTGLTSITIPGSVQTIGFLSFGTTYLTQITFDLPSSLTTIGAYAFQSSTFSSVTIPASATSVSNTAFQANNNLTTINYLGTIPSGWPWSAPASVTVSGNVNCGTTGYFVISENTVVGRKDCTGSVVIPVGVTAIGGEAFDAAQDYGGGVGRENPYGSTIATNITSLTIPNTVTSIDWFAFRSNRISSLVVPNSVSSIGIYAFADSTATTLTIGNGLSTISSAVFAYWPSLQTLTIGTQVRAIEDNAFVGANSLTSLTIPDGVDSIGSQAFANVGGPFTLNYCGNADLAGTGLPSQATNAASCAPASPRNLVATPANASASIAFTPGAAGGSAITNYKYSLNGTTYTSLSPAVTSSPVTIPGLTNGSSYTVYLKSVSAIGDGRASAPITFIAGTSAYTNAAIGGVSAPTLGAVPATTVIATSRYTGTISWSGSPAYFGGGTAYSATITLTPALGHTFAGVPANFFTVAGATSVSNAANSAVITAVFPILSGVVPCVTDGSVQGSGSFTIANNIVVSSMGCVGKAVIPMGVVAIGAGAFTGAASLTSASIPGTVTSIGISAFDGASSLSYVEFAGNAPATVGAHGFRAVGALAQARVESVATGFGIVGSSWNGLTVTVRTNQNQIQDVTTPNASIPAFKIRPLLLSSSSRTLTIRGDSMTDVNTLKIAGKVTKILQKLDGSILIETPALAEGKYDVEITHASGVITMQEMLQVVKPYELKRTQTVSRFKRNLPTADELAALKKLYLQGTTANLVNCVAIVASDSSVSAVARAMAQAKATCQAVLNFSVQRMSTNIEVSKSGKSGSKATLAVTFDRTLTTRG